MRRNHTDAEVVAGIWRHDKNMEEWFYASARSYFDLHFKDVFFDKDRKQEIFQTAFLKIWTEMTNGTISVSDSNVVRRRHTGEVQPMTCSLLTFVMAFAKWNIANSCAANDSTITARFSTVRNTPKR